MTGLPVEQPGGGRYLQALRQHWPFIVLSAAIAVAAAVLYSMSAQKEYKAQTDVLVNPIPTGSGSLVGIPLIAESATSRSVLTAARIVKSPQVAGGVRRRLATRRSVDELLDSIEVTPQQQSAILTIGATATDPQDAARLANAFADVLIAQRTAIFQRAVGTMIRRLEHRLEALGAASTSPEATALASRLGDLRGLAGGQDPTLQLVSGAVAPAAAEWPRPVLSVIVALAAGLLLGVGVAVGLELLNPLVLRDEDLGMPALAHIPRQSARAIAASASGERRLPEDVREAYRRVRFALATNNASLKLPRTILVTGAARDDGSTSVATGLALATAATGAKVVLVEANLRHAKLARTFGFPPGSNGLEAVLAGDVEAKDALVPVDVDSSRLQLLPSVPRRTSGVDLLQSPALGNVLGELDADVVVIDSPPAGAYPDALMIAREVDAVVITARHGRTRRDKLRALRRLLAQGGIVPAGAVVLPRRRFWHVQLASRTETESPTPEIDAVVPPPESHPRKPAGSRMAKAAGARDRAGSGRR